MGNKSRITATAGIREYLTKADPIMGDDLYSLFR